MIKVKTYNQFVSESFSSEDEDRFIVTHDGGKAIFEVIHDPYEYDFSGVVSESKYAKFLSDGPAVKIESIDAGPNKRRGIGTTLMDEGLQEMRKLGHTQFYLNASPKGTMRLLDLVKFYERFGFRIVQHQGNNAMMALSDKTINLPTYTEPPDAVYYTYERDPETYK